MTDMPFHIHMLTSSLAAINCRFPPDVYQTFEQGKNTYSTAICVLVSVVQKLSRCTRIPEDTLLYRVWVAS